MSNVYLACKKRGNEPETVSAQQWSPCQACFFFSTFKIVGYRRLAQPGAKCIPCPESESETLKTWKWIWPVTDFSRAHVQSQNLNTWKPENASDRPRTCPESKLETRKTWKPENASGLSWTFRDPCSESESANLKTWKCIWPVMDFSRAYVHSQNLKTWTPENVKTKKTKLKTWWCIWGKHWLCPIQWKIVHIYWVYIISSFRSF